MRFRLVVDGEAHDVVVRPRRGGAVVEVDGASYVAAVGKGAQGVAVRIGARRHRIEVRGVEVRVDGQRVDVLVRDVLADRGTQAAPGSGPTGVFEIRPPMPGRIVRLAVVAGGRVRRGDPIAVLEAMKMQNEIPAPADGVVREVHVREGETIGADRLIAVLEAS